MVDDDACGGVGETRIGGVNRNVRRKAAPMTFCPPKIPHDLGSNPSRRVGKATNINKIK
jgi:hypothetical protein